MASNWNSNSCRVDTTTEKRNKMGTRGLTVVIEGGEFRIAQYGQWDHYPGGQGITVLEFCREHMTKSEDVDRFRRNVKAVRWLTEEDTTKVYEELGIDGDAPFISMEDSGRIDSLLPYITRDHGAGILDLVLNHPEPRSEGKVELVLQDSREFIKDSLFCEWAYVLDLDHMQLEVYKGFNEKPVPQGQRFSEMESEKPAHRSKQYYPCVEAGLWKFDDLPSDEGFVQVLDSSDEEDEED